MNHPLITRLSKLDAPDREVDAQIYIHFVEPTWHTSHKDPGAVAADKNAFWPEGKLRYITSTSRTAPLYTASVDAAIALAERVLPGWQGLHLSAEWTGIRHPGNGVTHSAQLWESLHGYTYVNGKGANLAIALLIALLRAKEASNAE